jgi:hypothetical protein
MTQNERQQRMIERLQEDERLRGDLSGDAAQALVAWASEKVCQATEDPSRPDAEVEAEVQAIRSAARLVARSGENDARTVIAQANAALTQPASAPTAPLQAAHAPLAKAELAVDAPAGHTQPTPPASPNTREPQRPQTAKGSRTRRRLRDRIRNWLRQTRKDA